MTNTVNQKLYDFISECDQFDVIIHPKTKEIECILWISFYDIKEFTKILAEEGRFDESGFDVYMGEDFIAIDILYIIESESTILDYKNKFTNWDNLNKWELKLLEDRYKDEVK